MDNKNIHGSIVAGGDVTGSVNANNSEVSNEYKVLKEARKQSFWISLAVGIISSLIASVIYHIVVG